MNNFIFIGFAILFCGCNSSADPRAAESSPKSAFEDWEAANGPRLVFSFSASSSNRRALFDELLFRVNKILLGTSDPSIDEIVSSFEPVCDAITDLGLPVDAGTPQECAMGIAPFFHARHESRETEGYLCAFSLAHLDKLCPSQVRDNLVLKYVVIMQRIFLKTTRESGEPARWDSVYLGSNSADTFLDWLSQENPQNLRKGLLLSGNLSHREFFDFMATSIFGDDYRMTLNVENMFGVNSVLPLRLSETRVEAMGRFVAISFLEMEPLFMPFSREIVNGFLKTQSNSGNVYLAGLWRGFHSLVRPEELAGLMALDLIYILVGGDVRGRYVTIDPTSLRQNHIAELTLEHPRLVDSWATVAAHGRGVAIGHTGRKVVLKVTVLPTRSHMIERRGGWHVSVSPSYINRRLANLE